VHDPRVPAQRAPEVLHRHEGRPVRRGEGERGDGDLVVAEQGPACQVVRAQVRRDLEVRARGCVGGICEEGLGERVGQDIAVDGGVSVGGGREEREGFGVRGRREQRGGCFEGGGGGHGEAQGGGEKGEREVGEGGAGVGAGAGARGWLWWCGGERGVRSYGRDVSRRVRRCRYSYPGEPQGSGGGLSHRSLPTVPSVSGEKKPELTSPNSALEPALGEAGRCAEWRA